MALAMFGLHRNEMLIFAGGLGALAGWMGAVWWTLWSTRIRIDAAGWTVSAERVSVGRGAEGCGAEGPGGAAGA
ncbi:hypothetical protein PMAC_003315 [Pneumocystis sp. 'macacae']|nr:hypothetical protein PMAC_003315 [Pneumocystis sp. 'macacae']